MEQKFRRLIKPLTHSCVIIESHGPTYRGIYQIKKWFNFWKHEKGKVIRWNINSCFFVKEKNITFVEWDFACNVSNKNHSLFGISIFKFKGNKISFIQEYRMTKNPYKWKAFQLNPE